MKSDIVIIGAGAAGLSLATLLAENNINITIIEKSDLKNIKNPEYDGRETALTHPSIKILKEINAWQNIEKESISPILEAKVLNGYSKYSLDFDSKNTNQEALGYLVANNVIRKALFKEVEKLKNIDIIAGMTDRPEDIVGLHFFSPANVMKLLEIVQAKQTSSRVINTCMQVAQKIKKMPKGHRIFTSRARV